MYIKSIKITIALMIVFSLLLAACGETGGAEATATTAPTKPPEPTATTMPAGGTINLHLPGDWDTLDPHKTRNSNGYQMAFLLYDRLLNIDRDGKVVPFLAESWTQTADSVTLTLRGDVTPTCTDGTPVTASVVAESLKRMGAPETEAPYAYRTVGREGFTVTADDAAGTVTVTTEKPFSDLLIGLAMPWASIVCPAGLEDPEAMTSEPAGSGAFILESSLRGDTYTVKARPEYNWGPNGMTTSQPGYPDTIVVRVVENNTTAANMILAGELDIASPSGQDMERVLDDESLYKISWINFGTTWLLINEAEGRIGADPVVRHAIMMAVNREAWNQAASFGQGIIASSVIMPSVDCFDPATEDLVAKYDPEGAKALLEEAGWTMGDDGYYQKDGQTLQVKITGTEGDNAGPEYLLEAIEAIGVKGDLAVLDFNSALDTWFGSGEWDVAPFPFGPPMPSPNTASPFVSGDPPGAGSNIAHINNEAYNEAAAAALAAGTPEDRCENWGKAQRALLESYDLKPLVATAGWFFGNGVEFGLFGTYAVVDPFGIKRIQ